MTLAPKFGDVSTKFFVAGNDNGNEENVYLIGASGSMNFDALKLFGEVDFFDGDSKVKDQDAFGSQLFLDASLAAVGFL